VSDRLLHIYINDHLGAATAGREVTKRCLESNTGTPLGDFLMQLLREINEDRATVEEVLAATNGRRDRFKPALGWMVEKAGRLKLNGQVRGYSPLSRVEELEGISAGIEAKRAMWIAFQLLGDPRLAGFDFEVLIHRASAQREGLERFRKDAVAQAFGRR
jgi:hypothetical protein